MSCSRKKLLVFGFMREFCASINQDYPTKDLIHLFAKWLALTDRWDQEMSHHDIAITSELEAVCEGSIACATCIGKYVIKKGEKQIWKLKSTSSAIMVGIISDEIVKSNKDIGDFTAVQYKGFGLSVSFATKYHDAHNLPGDDDTFIYAQQFNLPDADELKGIVFEMELDLTQKENENGILKYVFHQHGIDIDKIETNGKFTNIAYDCLDVNTESSLAVDIGG